MPAPAETTSKINSFAELPAGWHFGEGMPPSPDRVKNARLLHFEFVRSGFTRTNAFPGIDGQIMVTAYRGSEYHEFSLELDGSLDYVFELGNEEQDCKENLSLEEALEIVRELANIVWLTLESSTTLILTPTRVTLKAMPSGTLLMGAGFPWLMRIAPSGRVLTSVPTSVVSTLYRPMTQPFFGGYTLGYFPANIISYNQLARLGTSAISTSKDFLTKRQNKSSSLPQGTTYEFA